MAMEPSQIYDTLIIGGGPGGLTAAVYLRRFRRDVLVVDKGNSRLQLIPVTHNFPGFPDGIRGTQLLENLRSQLARYGGHVTDGEITSLARNGDYFSAGFEGGEYHARTVLLATGISDAGLPIENWREAVAGGAVRLCPVCDAFDVLDKRIAVIGEPGNCVSHALFLRTFSSSVTLFQREPGSCPGAEQLQRLDEANVTRVESPLRGVSMTADLKPVLHTEDGVDHPFDVVYPMLGETARSDLATALGAETTDCEKLVVDEYQATSVPGLYAIGDVVKGLNQISVAVGHAAVAATRIHNRLPCRYRE
ncbi:MAG: NAD(P)/FAD-dependent oxidoreductase [Telluria sp.]